MRGCATVILTSLLLGDGSQHWYDMLGVKPDADKATITNAFRAMAKTHHPDAGGDAETFKRLRTAYEQGIKAREGKP